MSRDIVIIVVPFSQIQHPINKSYGDYWRLAPSAIRRLFQENNLEVVYEAESPHVDAAVYLFFVGSRYPEQWRKRLPEYTLIKQAGAWIGDKKKVGETNGLQFLRAFLRKCIENFWLCCKN